MSIEVTEAWKTIWAEEVKEVKKQYPHISEEGAKLLALEIATPRFVLAVMNQEPKKPKESKNVKTRKAKQGDDQQTELDISGTT